MRKIIAIDFDNTLFKTSFPYIQEPNWKAIRAAKKAQYNGAALILWTCRTGEDLLEAVDACRDVGLEFDAVNDNLPEIKKAFGGDTRKVVADEYWDDLAVNWSCS